MPNIVNWLTLAQASKDSGKPRRTLLHHIHTGRLKAHKLAGETGAWVVNPKDLAAYINSCEKAAS